MVCAIENGGAQCPPLPGLLYEFCKFNSQSSQKGNCSTCTKLLGVGFKKLVLNFSFLSLALLIFLAEVTVLLSPLVHLTLFFGW